MDTVEATKKVLSRIQSFDPQNASKIMGYILIQEHGDKDIIRLAHGPDSALFFLINEAKSFLGLSSNSSSAPRLQSRIAIPNNGLYSPPAQSPVPANGSSGFPDSSIPVDQPPSFLDDYCNSLVFPSEETHLPFLHGASIDEFLHIKALQQRRFSAASSGHYYPFTHNNCMGNLNGNPRSEFPRFGPYLSEGCEFSRVSLDGYSISCSRQIYLTFPADSTFSEADVSNYFSIYGPVLDVRIPYQQKRMFGFVTFAYPETVKLILAKGNPHFVCDSRVLVKPYKEKGKVPDKNRKAQQHHMGIGKFIACLSTSGVDSREPHDLPFGPRMFNNSLRRQLEQEAIELHTRRLMNLQLVDPKDKENCDQFQSSSSPIFPVSYQSNSQLPTRRINFGSFSYGTESNGSHDVGVGQENNNRSENSCKEQCNIFDYPELHKSGLVDVPPGTFVASSPENLPASTETDENFSSTPFANNTSTLGFPSLQVCCMKIPRLTSDQEAIEV